MANSVLVAPLRENAEAKHSRPLIYLLILQKEFQHCDRFIRRACNNTQVNSSVYFTHWAGYNLTTLQNIKFNFKFEKNELQ